MIANIKKIVRVFAKHIYVFLKICILLLQSKYHTVQRQGSKMLLDLKDKGVGRELAINKIHEA